MSFLMPGWASNLSKPDPVMIQNLYTVGVIQRQIRAFADGADYSITAGMNSPPPLSGPAKYWTLPYPNRPPAFVHFKVKDGAVVLRKFDRTMADNVLMAVLGGQAQSMFGRKGCEHLLAPVLEVRETGYSEAGRLSFNPPEAGGPGAYPICSAMSFGAQGEGDSLWYEWVEHDFPSNVILYSDPKRAGGAIMAATMTDFMREYPWMP